MALQIEVRHHLTLDAYEAVGHLSSAVRGLKERASELRPALQGRRVWMVNSTAKGGGVAELLPPFLRLSRDLGVQVEWLVIDPPGPEFFRLTKTLHNMLHGEGPPRLERADRELYESVSRTIAADLARYVTAGDVLVIHDPQPLGAGAFLRREMDVTAVWRCHIGLDRETPRTLAAWEFLAPYASAYDHVVFTAAEYVPRYLTERATIIPPAIDPLSHKNRDLPIRKLVGVLADGGLIKPPGPLLAPPFPEVAQQLQPNGAWSPAAEGDDVGLLFRPIVTQISRWDRLKGFLPLMQGFLKLKTDLAGAPHLSPLARRTLDLARLVFAGPDPASVADDPEGQEVLTEIAEQYRGLSGPLQADIAVISLPMGSTKYNALLVNALQRCSDIVAQNSIREGFGLTATEAMWKHIAVMGTQAAGLRQQIRDGIDGRLVSDARDPAEIAQTLLDLLTDPPRREALGRSAQRRVHDEFLVFTEVRRWLELLAALIPAGRPAPPRSA